MLKNILIATLSLSCPFHIFLVSTFNIIRYIQSISVLIFWIITRPRVFLFLNRVLVFKFPIFNESNKPPVLKRGSLTIEEAGTARIHLAKKDNLGKWRFYTSHQYDQLHHVARLLLPGIVVIIQFRSEIKNGIFSSNTLLTGASLKVASYSH